ncbi:hypothetical protein G6F63_013993 [Rhizopus arrhizus]|nr:hypothetical protein G6F63_013993 [Rhizopus arrhizus]
MDYIGVLEFDAKGKIIGEQRFLGLFTSSAYNRRPWEIPLVRQRHEHVMKQSGLAPASRSGKALRPILETLPREELFQSSEDELFRTAMGPFHFRTGLPAARALQHRRAPAHRSDAEGRAARRVRRQLGGAGRIAAGPGAPDRASEAG